MTRKRVVGPWRFGSQVALQGAALASAVAGGSANIVGKALQGAAVGRVSAVGDVTVTSAAIINASPADYQAKINALLPGQTLQLAPGDYTSSGMSIYNINGTAQAPITIQGPSDRSAIIRGSAGNNTVRISGSSYVTLKNITVNSDRLGGDGIHAQSNVGASHHITIENCLITGCDDSQSTVGIATNSISVWDWTVKNCDFSGCGTGMYLGNSDGSAPFVEGVIDGNFFTDCIGYDIEIKGQTVWGSSIAGRPEGTTKTIVRNNVFNKNAATSSTGGNARPNLLIGGVASTGTGSSNTYEVYGNFFVGNPTAEPLFQFAGNMYCYGNLFYNIDGASSLGAIYARDWTSTAPVTTAPVKNVEIFGNTIVIDSGIGIDISSTAGPTRRCIGNAIYAPTAFALSNATQTANVTGTFSNATATLNKPDGVLASDLDLHPQAGALSGTSYLDSATWSVLTDYDKDFNSSTRDWAIRGGYSTRGVNPGWFLQLARKGTGISAPSSTGLTLTLGTNEGFGSQLNGQLYWQSAFTTIDGKLIHWGTGDHNTGADNGVREYNPLTKTQVYVYPNNNGTIDQSQYDNHCYWYVPNIDTLVIPSRGSYVRSSGIWSRGNLKSDWASGNTVLGTDSRCLIYQDASVDYDELTGRFNAFACWSEQFNSGVAFGGGYGGGQPAAQSMWIVVPSWRRGSFAQPYHMIKRAMPQVGGIDTAWKAGRDGCCFVGEYLYWVGGNNPGTGVQTDGPPVPYFWRMKFTPHLNSTIAPLAIERLPDMPQADSYNRLSYVPMANVLVMVNSYGFHTFDLATSTWTTHATETAAYATVFGSYAMPRNVNGDYFHSIGGTLQRKLWWRPGAGNNWDAFAGSLQEKYFSLGVTRGQSISYLDVEIEDPTNPANTVAWVNGGLWPLYGKHTSIIEGSNAIYLSSGDWNGFPGNQRSDYPPSASWDADGRQEKWFADTSPAALASGKVRFKLAQNFYHNYPWDGSGGYFGPGRPGGGVEPQRGPYMPDAIGWIVDKRGDFWMGPCDVGYSAVTGDAAGEQLTYAPMYRWRMPGLHTNGIRMGGDGSGVGTTGYYRPPQTRLLKPTNGTPEAHDIEPTSSSAVCGWGRPNKSVYDATNDKIYVVSVAAGATTFTINLFGFPCVPTAGTHTWTRSSDIVINVRDVGGPSSYSGINMTGWGDARKGTIFAADRMIGRNMYFVFCAAYSVSSGGNRTATTLTRAHLVSLNVDSLTVQWIPLPQHYNWWLRVWDGPHAASGNSLSLALTPAQYRPLTCVGTKLVLGPDSWMRINEDPWLSVYDTATGTWSLFDPPGSNDWPKTTGGGFIAMPSLGEVWLAGVHVMDNPGEAEYDFMVANGMHTPWKVYHDSGLFPGRRIVRFKVT